VRDNNQYSLTTGLHNRILDPQRTFTIEVLSWFVKNDYRGIGKQGSCNSQSLGFSTRKCAPHLTQHLIK
jgi:hypothetical protein